MCEFCEAPVKEQRDTTAHNGKAAKFTVPINEDKAKKAAAYWDTYNKDTYEQDEKTKACEAGQLGIKTVLKGDGTFRQVQLRCLKWHCRQCGPWMAQELGNRVQRDLAARGAQKLTRLVVEGDLSTPQGKKLRAAINKVCKNADCPHTVMPHEGHFIVHMIGRFDVKGMLGGLLVSDERIKPRDVDWFADCQTTGNKSGTLGKKVPKTSTPKEGTAVRAPKAELSPGGITREDRIEAIRAAYRKTDGLCASLPKGELNEKQIALVEQAYKRRMSVYVQEIEKRGGTIKVLGWSKVFYSGWKPYKNLLLNDIRLDTPEFLTPIKKVAASTLTPH